MFWIDWYRPQSRSVEQKDVGVRYMSASALATAAYVRRPRAADIDRYVGLRLRDRRLQLGLTQQQMADQIGVTYQQAHKYEKGINRLASGRLYVVAQALGVDVSYFFEGFDSSNPGPRHTSSQRRMLELTRNFTGISSRQQQVALCNLVRVLSLLNSECEAEHDGAADDQL
ncbi:MAG: helix-turn-helix domain-containing protein [Geminicoccaceae bacterium]